MGLLGLISGKTKVQFIQNNNAVIVFDASIKETHSRESSPTENPIENGQVISDHMIIKPFALELQGIITDSPIGGIQGLIQEAATSVVSRLLPPIGVIAASAGVALFSTLAKSKKPSVAAYGQLLQLQAAAQPFTVITSLYRYENMWIKSISVPREAASGNALEFTVSVVQLLLVSPQSVNISIFANPGLSANKNDNGGQNAGLASRFQQGVTDATQAAKGVGLGGLSGTP